MADNQASNGVVHEVSNIARWYDNRSVFITGATGFMGKVLVEKLLSSCPGINQVFVLLRRKKDVSPEKRLDQLKQTSIFDVLRRQWPQRLDKIVIINGDMLHPDLGISTEDLRTIQACVSVVFHCAATVRFEEALRLSVTLNILGTKRMMNIARKMVKLEAFVHVSTAYCNCERQVVDEVIYPPPGDNDRLMQCLDCLDDEMVKTMTPKFIGKHPNTYTFTKAMAEHILEKDGAGMPITIIRPSIVSATLSSPLAGWVDNLNGPSGVLAGCGKGILRSMICRRDLVSDIIPVDLCINAMIVAAWNTAKEKHAPLKVYNVTTGQSNPILWGQLEKWGKEQMFKHPFDDIMWYPGGSFKSSKVLNFICIGIFQLFPAYLIDFTAKILGKKQNASMVRVQNKMINSMQILEYFLTHEWTFLNKNVLHLQSKLTESDRKMFDMDVTNIKWVPYMEQYVLGVRRYILKEKDKDIPKAKQHMKRMYLLHQFSKALLLFAFYKLLVGNSALANKISYNVISFALIAINKLSTVFSK